MSLFRCMASANSESVTVWVGKRHLPCPRLLLDRSTKLFGDAVYIVHVEINQRVGLGVTFVLRQVELYVTAP